MPEEERFINLMTKFSANLGFLWTDRPLADAIRAAGSAGFDAVECHWPYDEPVDDVRAALAETGLVMLGLNTLRDYSSTDSNMASGEAGLAALPGREPDARATIDMALSYARQINAGYIHVMAGNAEGPEAKACFIENLRYATKKAAADGRTIMIEPLNAFDAPGYFLRTTAAARRIISAVGARNLRLMFDCYHVARTEGDVAGCLNRMIDIIGHIQFSMMPDRGPPCPATHHDQTFGPDYGPDYEMLFQHIADLGYTAPLGAEYRPTGGDTDASLGWVSDARFRAR